MEVIPESIPRDLDNAHSAVSPPLMMSELGLYSAMDTAFCFDQSSTPLRSVGFYNLSHLYRDSVTIFKLRCYFVIAFFLTSGFCFLISKLHAVR